MSTRPESILTFWRDAGYERWFARDADFDARCAGLVDAHHAAARRELEHFMDTPDGALALCILLGTAASPVMDYLDHAATSLHEPQDYIRNVLEPVTHGTRAAP